MRHATIFIGSATEAIEGFSEPIAASLEDKFTVLRWWKEFPGGSYTLERLVELSKTVDYAIFICSAEDTTWIRGREVGSPPQ